MKKRNPNRNTYYWRAVRRIAKRKGISISKARTLDWEKETRAEFRRRSKGHVPTVSKKRRVPTTKPKSVSHGSRSKRRKRSEEPSYVRRGPLVTGGPGGKLKFRRYETIPVQEEEEFEDEESFAEEWETGGYLGDWAELNDLDNLEGFLQDFEYEDSDKYKEPA